MIRFIDLRGQIFDVLSQREEQDPQFAFYNTVSDVFVDVNGTQTWDSFESFEEDCRYDINKNGADWDIDRYRGLCPERAFKKHCLLNKK